ncbi:MAG: response regulator [Gammaproteobacteria bacterium]|nr:response regulator [Gammaproteobacteria bacterium]
MNPNVIIVDDDIAFCNALSRAFTKREYTIISAHSVEELQKLDSLERIDYGVVDLRIGEDSGLNAIKYLLEKNPNIKIVMLTAYASIATTVEAMKLGAINYLTKPASVQEIIDKLLQTPSEDNTTIEETTLSVRRLEWEHLQKVLLEHDGNISAAARALNMHRRTLQRKLQKRPVKR